MSDYVVNLKTPPETAQSIATKLNTLVEAIDVSVIDGAVTRKEFREIGDIFVKKDVLEKIVERTNKQVQSVNDSIYVIEQGRKKLADLRWHGGGSSSSSTGGAVSSVFGRTGAVIAVSGDYTTATVPDSTNKRYVTDAELVVLANTSGVNTGNQTNGNMTVYTIAASNSSTTDKANADFTCTGTADQTQINTYISTLLAAKGGSLLFAAGTYNLSSTIAITGDGSSNGPTISIMGAGNRNTIFVPASGTHAFTITGATQVNIWNVAGTLAGSSDFIHTTSNNSAPYWSFWLSSFKNIFVKGDFSAHSGWLMNMENPFRSTFENIEGQGIGNGIYLKTSTASPNYNPGNSTFLRCFMDLNGAANGVAYKIHTVDSNTSGSLMNILTFIHCEAIDSKSSSTTSIGWYLLGNSLLYPATKDITIINSNIEQFNTCVKLVHAVENHVHLSYADTKTSGTIFDVSSDSQKNELYADSGYVAPAATTKFLNDANTSATAPTIAGGYEAYIDTGGTLSITKSSSTILTKNAVSGPGTIPTEFTTFDLPANVIQRVLVSSTAPSTDQVLTATGVAAATWQTPSITATSTTTVSNKRNTKRVVTTTQSATPIINTDNTDVAEITGLAQAITSFTTNISGTANAMDSLIINITDNGTARAISWGSSFESSGNVTLPTTTVISTKLTVGFFWNTATSKWRCVAVA